MVEIFTSGITGVACASVLVYLIINIIKRGWLGKLSRWLASAGSKEAYGGRILTLSVCISAIINLIQWAAMTGQGDYATVWMILLRIIACSLLASGGYEYMKTIAKNLPGPGGGENGVE